MHASLLPSYFKKLFISVHNRKQTAEHFGSFRHTQKRFVSKNKMSEAKEFPPQKIRAIVTEVAALLKERKETVSVAETVSLHSLSNLGFHIKCLSKG